jgi:hypothetical protein
MRPRPSERLIWLDHVVVGRLRASPNAEAIRHSVLADQRKGRAAPPRSPPPRPQNWPLRPLALAAPRSPNRRQARRQHGPQAARQARRNPRLGPSWQAARPTRFRGGNAREV